MKKLSNIGALALAALLAAGCGAATDTAGAQQPAAPSPRESAPPATQPAAGDSALGATQTVRDPVATVKVVAYRYRQPLPSAFPPSRKGYTFAGVEARLCLPDIAKGDRVGVSGAAWSLEYSDDTVIDPAFAWSDDWFSVPLYPVTRTVREGRCVRGWIVFEVPRAKRPVSVAYAPRGGGAADPVVWRIR